MEEGYWKRGFSVTNKVIPLRDLIDMRSEKIVNETLSSFFCSKDKDVQRYLRETAVKHEKEHISRTYLIFDSEPSERLVAFITVAMKCLIVGDEQYDVSLIEKMNVNNGTAQSYLIGQLGKVDGYGKVGDFAISFAIGIIMQANQLVGCRTIRLDCKDALVGYYEKNGFVHLSRNNKKNLNRMVWIIT